MSNLLRVLGWPYRTCVAALDLGGADGRFSFSKGVTILALALGAFTSLPTVLGVAAIAASFGVKTFALFLRRSEFEARAETIRQSISVEFEPRQWADGRDPDAGIL